MTKELGEYQRRERLNDFHFIRGFIRAKLDDKEWERIKPELYRVEAFIGDYWHCEVVGVGGGDQEKKKT